MVIETLSAATGETIAPNGAAAAPWGWRPECLSVRSIWSGRSRSIKLGAQMLELRHAPQWQLVLAGAPAGDAVRALSWLREKHAGDTVKTLERRLPPNELKAIADIRGRLPTWMARELSPLAAHA
ncbi:MAG TPA: hypothetical protein VG248_08215 [Caulobacteraceae bacterium]|jgi:hypothetical protein|nr:hypothetical protein [Caulobacteraceae bacterium]